MFSGLSSTFAQFTSSTFPGKIQDPAVLKQKWEKKRVLIIGGTAGIGRGLAINLIKNDVSVTIVGTRDPDPELHKAKFVRKDLSLMKNAIALVSEVDVSTLDIIVFTVGVFAGPEREETEDGIERDLAISYLSRLAFVKKLVETCKFGVKRADKSFKPRIFVMGYPGKNTAADIDDFNSVKSYAPLTAHDNGICGNECLVQYIAQMESGVNVYGLNPGLIKTGLREKFLGKDSYSAYGVDMIASVVSQTPEQYAENVLRHLLVSPALDNMNKSLFDYAGYPLQPSACLTDRFREKVINESEDLLVKASKNTKFNKALNKGLKAIDKLSDNLESEIVGATKPSLQQNVQAKTLGAMLKGAM